MNLEKRLKAVANKKRIEIINILAKKGELKLNAIIAKMKLPYQTTFRNLSVLRTAGFLDSRIYKGTAYFKISDNLNPSAKTLIKLISQNKLNLTFYKKREIG